MATTLDRRVRERLRGFAQGEAPDDLDVPFFTTEGQPVTGLDGGDATARFLRPNGTTIDRTGLTITDDQAVVTWPDLDETGVWYLEAWVTKDTLTYASRLYVFDVGDPIIPAPGDPPPPGDTFVTQTGLDALVGLPGGLLPDGTPGDGWVPTFDLGTGTVIWAVQTGQEALASYHHVQSTPAAVWTVTHNLGFKPGGIYVEDSAHNQLFPRVAHVDANTLTLSFFSAGAPAATGGEADIS